MAMAFPVDGTTDFLSMQPVLPQRDACGAVPDEIIFPEK
jgi:hypothetical protein